jgi:hypothetical protein
VKLLEAWSATGRRVSYRAWPGGRAEYGEIVRTNSTYVFVLYDGESTPKATPPDSLTFVD